jgi:DNA-binding LacI/PurR family transcriptional regulator
MARAAGVSRATAGADIAAAQHSGPALATATHPVERIATAAARAALTRAADGAMLFASDLVLRKSA